MSCCKSKGAEDGLWVADPLEVLPEDLHHLRAHLLIKRHLYQLQEILVKLHQHVLKPPLNVGMGQWVNFRCISAKIPLCFATKHLLKCADLQLPHLNTTLASQPMYGFHNKHASTHI